ncbi:Golgi phosphoprotein 3-domain-containing protein [Mycena rebaudengoi]|nr:Golgi phosphoprotein 3-domain-containing protein [Mycena rebaudengoi]
MAPSGLSRRRANAPTTTTHDDDDNAPSSPPASAIPAEKSPEAQLQSLGLTGGAHAGSAFANGSRVAYDPRDLLPSSQESAAQSLGGSVPKLTLMEEVLLLGIKDKQGYLSFWNDNISHALRGCILMELALRRRIGVVRDPMTADLLTERPVTVLSTRQTGETLLDETLKMMKQTEDSGERMGVATWVDLLSGKCRVPTACYTPSLPFLPPRSPFLRVLGFGGATHHRIAGITPCSFPRSADFPAGVSLAHYDTCCSAALRVTGGVAGGHQRYAHAILSGVIPSPFIRPALPARLRAPIPFVYGAYSTTAQRLSVVVHTLRLWCA